MTTIIPFRASSHYWLSRAQSYEAEGDWPQAAIAFARALAQDAHLIRAWLGLARALLAVQRFDQAERALYRVLEHSNCDPHAYWLLAECYKKQEREVSLRFCLGWLLMMTPDHIPARTELALALERIGRDWDAKRHWLQVIRLAPHSPEAALARGRLGL